MLELTDNPDIDANDYVMARNMAEALHKHYPGHLWAVTCEGSKGIATIRDLALSAKYGVLLHLKNIYGDTQMRLVINAGGEILERFKQIRGRMNSAHIEGLPHGPDGFPVFDTAGMKGPIPIWQDSKPQK